MSFGITCLIAASTSQPAIIELILFNILRRSLRNFFLLYLSPQLVQHFVCYLNFSRLISLFCHSAKRFYSAVAQQSNSKLTESVSKNEIRIRNGINP